MTESTRFPPEFFAALIAEIGPVVDEMVRAAIAKSEAISGASPSTNGDPRRGMTPYRRRQTQSLVARARRDGVTLDVDAADKLLDGRGALKFKRRASDSKHAAEKAFKYCEAQREFNRRIVPFREAFAYFLGYRPKAP